MQKGLLIVLSGPSGVGKGTVCTALRECSPDLVYSVSATTRKPRAGEVDGVNYFFKSEQEFLDMIRRNELLEWAKYVDNYYGTPSEFVRSTLESGKDIILEIEVQGAMKVREQFPEGVFIFLLPPSMEELHSRITNRGTESIETIRQRMDAAQDELALLEHYDYAVTNDSVAAACARINAIITAEHCKKERVMPELTNWFEEVK